MYYTQTDVERTATSQYLNDVQAGLDAGDPMPSSEEMEAELLGTTQNYFFAYNQSLTKTNKDMKWTVPKTLTNEQIAALVSFKYHFRRLIGGSDEDKDLLVVYNAGRGIYTSSVTIMKSMCREFSSKIKTKADWDSIFDNIYERAERVTQCQDQDIIPVANGLFNYKTKELLPFSPDYVILTKSPINFNPNAQNVVIHNDDGTDWDVESWMESLSDDPQVIHSLWQIAGACLRPYVPWDCGAWFVGKSGANGKGTLLTMLRNLLGEDNIASVNLKEFTKEFGLEPLIGKLAVMSDENPVGIYIDDCAPLKAAMTGDVLNINRKSEKMIMYRFLGFIIQCINEETPKLRDKSASFYRRQIYIPFTKCYTGKEKKYIKKDYLARADVLEYVMKKVLSDMPMYYDIDRPDISYEMLGEVREANDPVRMFLKEVLPQLQWNCIKFADLYALYKGWFKINNPSGTPVSSRGFQETVIDCIPEMDDGNWEVPVDGKGKPKPFGACGGMYNFEPLFEELRCDDVPYGYKNEWVWRDNSYKVTPSTLKGIRKIKHLNSQRKNGLLMNGDLSGN